MVQSYIVSDSSSKSYLHFTAGKDDRGQAQDQDSLHGDIYTTQAVQNQPNQDMMFELELIFQQILK